MITNTSSSKLPGNSELGHSLAQWIKERGDISCEMAVEAAADALQRGEPEVAILFCRVARRLLRERETAVRQGFRGRFSSSRKPTLRSRAAAR